MLGQGLGKASGGIIGSGSATTFDRTGDAYLTSGALTGGAGKAELVIWCAYRRGAEGRYLMGNASTYFSLYLDAVSSAKLVLSLPYSGSGGTFDLSAVVPSDDWCYILISINTNAISRYIHWGGTLGNKISGTIAVPSVSIDCNPSEWGIGKDPSGGSSHYRGEVGVFGVGFLTALDGTPLAPSLDLTDADVVRRFVKDDGTIVIDGGDGSSYTGVQPLIYMRGGATSFVNNLGSGGAFTPTGTFTTYIDPVIIDP